MENTTQLFLAVRFNCNKCHDHPFERWTQDQYYNLAAYFAQVGRKEDPKYKGQKIGGTRRRGRACRWSRSSRTRRPARSSTRAPAQVATPKFPFTHKDLAAADASRREQLAQLDHLEGEPLLRQELRQPPLELPARRRHHRAGGRHPRRQPADQPGAARPADRGVRQERLRRRGT